jgi:hypothetical protein
MTDEEQVMAILMAGSQPICADCLFVATGLPHRRVMQVLTTGVGSIFHEDDPAECQGCHRQTAVFSYS